MAKSILLGLAAVFATAVVSTFAESLVFLHHLPRDPLGREVGVDLVTLGKDKLYTPTGIVAAAVIFALAVLLSRKTVARPGSTPSD
jgi:hypothetical protein